MAATPQTKQTEEQVSLKLLVNKDTNKVIFAEANNDFVDVLCSFLTLPLGTIARLVEKESDMGPVTVGCLNSLYRSVADLDKGCFWNETSKEMLLHPKNSSEDYCSTLKLNIDDTNTKSPSQSIKYFICSNLDCVYYRVSTSTSTINDCPCGSPLTRSVVFKHFSKGFVSRVATFVITDDLIVMPNSMDYTSLALLQNSQINSTSSVKEMTVNVTREKVLELLKCALLSKSVLTDSFIGKKPSLESSRFVLCDFENTASIQIKLKLFMKKTDDKILFAQGEEDFADLILSFLTFPLGGVVRKLGGKSSLDSIDGLYKSIADLDEKRYLMSMQAKSSLLDPHLAPQFKFSKQILPTQQPFSSFYLHYQRESYKESVTHNEFFLNHDYMSTKCRYLNLNTNSPYVTDNVSVKGPRTYVVTDDLVIVPTSPISALHLINRLGTPLKDLHEKAVTIGIQECLNILKASLTSTSALTTGLRHLLTEVKE